MVVRRPGKIIEIDGNSFVRLYVANLHNRIDVIVMTVDTSAVEYGLIQIDNKEITFTDREDVELIIRSLVEGEIKRWNDVVYYDEADNWLLYYFRGEDALFAASDDWVYPLGSVEDAISAAAEVSEELRDVVAGFISLLP